MTRDEFLARLEEALRSRSVAVSRADLVRFLDAYWPLVECDPDPAKWAGQFPRETPPAPGAGA
jgi:hypothetical protein